MAGIYVGNLRSKEMFLCGKWAIWAGFREKGLNINNSKELRLEEAEGNSPGQRPVVIIVSHICVALKEQKNYAFSIKDFFQEFENFLSCEFLTFNY